MLEAYIDLWKGIQYRKSTKDYLTDTTFVLRIH